MIYRRRERGSIGIATWRCIFQDWITDLHFGGAYPRFFGPGSKFKVLVLPRWFFDRAWRDGPLRG
jgi:hypothetical protein